MGADDERLERGRRIMREVTGTEAPDTQSPAITVSLLPFVFGDVWSRDGITRKERRWIALTCAAAMGAEPATAAHLRGALASGDITVDELQEWVLQMTVYVGWPRAAMLETTLRRLAAELEG